MNDTLAPVNIPPAGNPARALFVLTLCFNLVPLAGVVFWGWSAFELIFLYWLENVVIGVRTLMMILLSARFHGVIPAVMVGGFFCFHYGMFCLVHGTMITGIFGGSEIAHASGLNPLDAIPLVPATSVGLSAIIVWQAALLGLHVARGDRSTPTELMGAPYPRIMILHLSVMLGAFALMALGWPQAGVVMLAVMKTLLDTGLAFRTAGKASNAPTPTSIQPPSRLHP